MMDAACEFLAARPWLTCFLVCGSILLAFALENPQWN